MRGSFGARHLAALCAHWMGALYQVARPDREQRRRPSVTGEYPLDLVLPQQAARPRRGGVAQELGQRRVYYADPDIYDPVHPSSHALPSQMMCDGQSMSVALGRCRTMCTMGHGHYGAGFCRVRRTIMGTAATTAVERHATARDPRCVGFEGERATSGHRIATRSWLGCVSASAPFLRWRLVAS